MSVRMMDEAEAILADLEGEEAVIECREIAADARAADLAKRNEAVREAMADYLNAFGETPDIGGLPDTLDDKIAEELNKAIEDGEPFADAEEFHHVLGIQNDGGDEPAEDGRPFASDAGWNEADHPRGQPDNAGQFGPGSGGGSSEGNAIKPDEREPRGDSGAKKR